MPKVSAVIITYNEEKNLLLSLPQLTWCDEIIIVDSGSTDGTLKICKSFGCKIYHKIFAGYGEQKQYAVAMASNDWVLCLDADEVLSNELVTEMRQEMQNPIADAFYIPMSLVFMGKTFRHGKESGRYFLRLFNRTKGGFNASKVHEKIEIDGTTKKLTNLIYHHSYRSFSQYFDKFNRYSSYGAEMAFHKGKKRSSGEIVMAIPLNFLKYYFLQLNFLNGLHGFSWSMLNSFYHFVKYIKLKEQYQLTPDVQSGNLVENVFILDSQLAPKLNQTVSV